MAVHAVSCEPGGDATVVQRLAERDCKDLAFPVHCARLSRALGRTRLSRTRRSRTRRSRTRRHCLLNVQEKREKHELNYEGHTFHFVDVVKLMTCSINNNF